MLAIARVNTGTAIILDVLLINFRPGFVCIWLAKEHIVDFLTLSIKVELCVGFFYDTTQYLERKCAPNKIPSASKDKDSALLVKPSSIWIVCVLPYY